MMELPTVAEVPPLRQEEDGAVRVGKSRVLLELVIYAHQQGMPPAEIVYNYDTLDLADVYAVIAYYLRHQEAVDAYVAEREAIGEYWRRICESRYDHEGLRRRMAAYREQLSQQT